ncbi:MAG: DUF3052 domain-containing protein [Acidimicrobiia bacterium]|nr:DUF3052 domain-containing protein [Acidimicrobiia bacterium]
MARPAGYSGTPLPKKLGIKDGHVVALLDQPPELAELLVPLPEPVELRADLRRSPDVIVAFFDRRAALHRRLPVMSRAIFPDGAMWIAWPKKSSGVSTDITEDTVREIALPTGLVDNKVCAISEVWSGLRLVHRRENRR